MKSFEYNPDRTELYRNGDFPPIDSGGSVDDGMEQAQADTDAKPLDKDAGIQEREQQLELWMTNIKAFIRGIDVNKL